MGNYYPPRDGHIREIDAGMVESEWTSRNLRRPVIKTFNNITWGSLQHEGLPRGAMDRIALPIAGDEYRSKRLVRDLVETLGFDASDAGSLSESWRYQPGTPAYCHDPTLKQLPLLLQRADRVKAPKSRDSSSKMMGQVVLEFPQPELSALPGSLPAWTRSNLEVGWRWSACSSQSWAPDLQVSRESLMVGK